MKTTTKTVNEQAGRHFDDEASDSRREQFNIYAGINQHIQRNTLCMDRTNREIEDMLTRK